MSLATTTPSLKPTRVASLWPKSWKMVKYHGSKTLTIWKIATLWRSSFSKWTVRKEFWWNTSWRCNRPVRVPDIFSMCDFLARHWLDTARDRETCSANPGPSRASRKCTKATGTIASIIANPSTSWFAAVLSVASGVDRCAVMLLRVLAAELSLPLLCWS